MSKSCMFMKVDVAHHQEATRLITVDVVQVTLHEEDASNLFVKKDLENSKSFFIFAKEKLVPMKSTVVMIRTCLLKTFRKTIPTHVWDDSDMKWLIHHITKNVMTYKNYHPKHDIEVFLHVPHIKGYVKDILDCYEIFDSTWYKVWLIDFLKKDSLIFKICNYERYSLHRCQISRSLCMKIVDCHDIRDFFSYLFTWRDSHMGSSFYDEMTELLQKHTSVEDMDKLILRKWGHKIAKNLRTEP